MSPYALKTKSTNNNVQICIGTSGGPSSLNKTNIFIYELKPDGSVTLIHEIKNQICKIDAIAYDQIENFIAFCSYNIKIYDIEKNRIRTFQEMNTRQLSIDFSPNNNILVSGTENGQVLIWDVLSGTVSRTLLRHTSRVYTVKFSHNGQYIASGSADKTICIWNANNGSIIRFIFHLKSVYSVAFNPNGKQIVSGSGDPIVRVWNINSNDLLKLHGHKSAIYSVTYTPNGLYIVSGSADKNICVWNSYSGLVVNLLNQNNSAITQVSFSYDGQKLFSSTSNNDTCIYDWKTIFKNISSLHIRILIIYIKLNKINEHIASIIFTLIYGKTDGYHFNEFAKLYLL